jgi:putative ABC transport system permease protein
VRDSIPIANILHRKLRSLLCVLAVGIGIAMMVVMLGLSHGTLNEVADRMESVPAELLVLPRGESAIYMAGGAFGEGHERLIAETRVNGERVVERVIPVLWQADSLGGQKQRIYGIDRDDIGAVFGTRTLVAGRMYDEQGVFKRAVAERAGPKGAYDTDAMAADVLRHGLELVIDERLARVGGFSVGDEVQALGRTFRIVGIVEGGVVGRVFAPIQVLRHIATSGIRRSTMFFVRLKDGAAPEAVAERIEREIGAQVVEKQTYRDLLYESFSQVYVYINIASGLALAVCFIFILLTMYTLVLERTREIGVLRSLGATRWYIVRLAMSEAVLLCTAGTVVGMGLAYVTKQVLERTLPLQTVDLQWRWFVLALLVGVVGGAASSIYPGYRAARLDPAVALSYE